MDLDIKQERDAENSLASGQYQQNIELELNKKPYVESAKCEGVVNVVFKHEDELVIDETWTEMHDDECEYQRKYESDVLYGYYTLNDFDDEEDKCEEANNDDYPIDGHDHVYGAEDESDDVSDEDTAGSSNKAKTTKPIKKSNDVDDTYCPNVIVIDKLLRHTVVVIECHLCHQKFTHVYRWTRHIKEKHSDFMVPVQAIYDYCTDNLAVCKLCKKELRYNSNRLLHYILNHQEQATKYLRCTFCNYKDFKLSSIQQHLRAKHPRSSILKQKCPLCSALMNEQCLQFHIMYQHTEEFQEKFNYTCDLCTHPSFGNSQPQYLYHLMNEHNLNNHEVLRFARFLETGEVYKCKKCFRLFVNESLPTLLEHALTHDIRFYWTCKFCQNKYKFTERTSTHVCSKMLKFFKKQQHQIIDADLIQPIRSENMTPAQPDDAKLILTNWQEFEQYVKHTCPFCNNEFSKFQLWQIHMIERHRLNTLEGLQMATVPAEPHKLQCLLCLTLITKTTINLYTHRFQHLPFKPYKCNLCSKSLGNYNVALQHIISKCRVEDPVISAVKKLQEKSCRILKIASDVKKLIQISCTLCNGKQFSRPGEINAHYQIKHNDFMEYFSKSFNGDTTECKICPSLMRRFDRQIGHAHFVQHLDQKPYKCKICQRSFINISQCKQHIIKYHNVVELESGEIDTATEVDAIPTEYQEFIGYACPECNESLSTHQLWLNHINGQHNFFDKSNVAFLDHATDKHKCKECNVFLTTSTAQQQQHKLSHMPYKPYICLLCYFRFSRLPDLHRHLNKGHFTKGLFVCPMCPKISCNTYERSEHIKQEHPQSEWPKNMCVLCLTVFTHISKHIETHEMSGSKHNCAICFISFIYLKDYEVHMTKKHKAVKQSTEPATCKAIAADSSKRNFIEHAKNLKKKKFEATTT